MSDAVWKRPEIDSPCINICSIHPEARICVGCYRSGDEIARWSAMNPEERRALRVVLPERAGLIKKRRGGRKARMTQSDKKPGSAPGMDW